MPQRRKQNAVQTAAIVDSVAQHYQRQNVERKSAEAAKTLDFLKGQLPVLKDQGSAQSEHDEHVAIPQQIRMQHADEEKGRHSPVMRGGSR